MSTAQLLPGHYKRYSFMKRFLWDSNLSIDFYGKGINYIEKKEEGLLDYEYSIAIENTSKPFYLTEKINDCFLCYTIPLYYGCTNIDRFFPKESYILLDIDRPLYALDKLKDILQNDDYYSHLPFLQEARELVLKKYGIPAWFRKLKPEIKKNIQNGKVKKYILERPPLYKNLRERIIRLFHLYPMRIIIRLSIDCYHLSLRGYLKLKSIF